MYKNRKILVSNLNFISILAVFSIIILVNTIYSGKLIRIEEVGSLIFVSPLVTLVLVFFIAKNKSSISNLAIGYFSTICSLLLFNAIDKAPSIEAIPSTIVAFSLAGFLPIVLIGASVLGVWCTLKAINHVFSKHSQPPPD